MLLLCWPQQPWSAVAPAPGPGAVTPAREPARGYPIGRLNRLITGWMAYFRLAQRVSVLVKLDGWLRRRLRQIRWKEWKTAAAKRHNLRIRGMSGSEARKWAGVSRRYWRVAGSQILQVALPNSYWHRLGLKTLSQTWQRLNPAA